MTTGSTLARHAHPEQGIALIGVLLLLVIISASTAALTVSGRTEIAISRNHEMATQAQVAAEAGLNHAVDVTLTFLRSWQSNGFATPSNAMTSFLLGPDNLSGTVATDADNGSLEAMGIPRSPARLALPGALGAQYEARLCDEDDPVRGLTLTAADLGRIVEDGQPTTDGNTQIVVQATGYASDGSLTTLEALIIPVDAPAVVSNGDLEVRGNTSIVGANGSVHANGDLDVMGNPTVSGDATASDGFTVTGSPTIGGYSGGGVSPHPVSAVSAIDYQWMADYILKADGKMTDGAGALICDAWVVATPCETAGYMWVFAGGNGWTASSVGANSDNQTYYAETDIATTGTTGTNADPLNITIIAEGNIDIGGNGVLEADTPGLLFVTDQDLKMAGNRDQVGADALIVVHEQISLQGNLSLRGGIVIEDAAAISNLVTASRLGVSGNVTITNSGTLQGTDFTVTAWREL